MKKGIQFYLIVVALSWLLWTPAVLNSYMNVPNIFMMVSMMASFVPTIVGIIFIRKYHKNIRDRLKFIWKPSVYLKILIIPFIGILTYLGLMILGKDIEITKFPQLMITFLVILFVGGALGEEFGWRGFLQYEFTDKLSYFKQSIVIGLMWSLWHLPLFFMKGTVQSNLPMIEFMLQNTLFAFYYTYFYKKTEGNILVAILFHAVSNTTAAVIPYWQYSEGRWLGFILLLLGIFTLELYDKKNYMLK